MADIVHTGLAPNDGGGDNLRSAMQQINQRFQQLLGTLSQITWAPGLAIQATPARQWTVVAGVAYVATTNHIAAASFATDLAAGRWLEVDVAQLIDDLAAPGGADLIGKSGSGTVQDHIDSVEALSVTGYANASAAISANPLGVLDIPAGVQSLSDVQLSGTGLRGRGPASILQASGTTTILRIGYVNSPSQWVKKRISDLAVDGNAKAADGLTFAASSSSELSGRWVLDGLHVSGCKKGINKPNGNIGNAILDCQFTGNDYGYFAVGQSSPLMHAGADSISRTHFDGHAKAAIYINSPVVGTGGTAIRDSIIENNAGFGVFVKNYNSSYTPLVLDNVWFENNATSPTADIEGDVLVPVDVHIENTSNAVYENSIVRKLRLINSTLTIQNSKIETGVSTWDIDSASSIVAENINIDGGAHPIVISSLSNATRRLGNFAPVFYGKPRTEQVRDTANVLIAESFSAAETYGFVGTGSVNATKIADGRVFDSCASLTVPASFTLLHTAFTVTVDKWYVLTVDVKHVSGALGELTFTVGNSGTFVQGLRPLLKTGQWVTLASIGFAASGFNARLSFANGATGTQVLNLSAYQVLEFDTKAEAIAFYNSGVYKVGTSVPRMFYQNAVPTVGTWAVGDRCVRRTPVVGQPKAWACTVAGTPGTWVSEGNL